MNLTQYDLLYRIVCFLINRIGFMRCIIELRDGICKLQNNNCIKRLIEFKSVNALYLFENINANIFAKYKITL